MVELNVAMPGSWSVASIELVDPGRAWISVAATVADGETLEAIATRHEAGLRGRLPGYQAGETQSVDDGAMAIRRYRWQADGAPETLEQATIYRLAGEVMYVAMLSGPAAASPEAVEAARQIVGSLSASSADVVRNYSVDELTALAELGGRPSFPGTGGHVFADDAARTAARAALLARGSILGVDNERRTFLAPTDARLVATVLQSKAVIDVEHHRGRSAERVLIHIGPHESVTQVAGAAGVHRFESVPTVAVADWVALMTEIGMRSTPAGEPMTIGTATFRALRAGTAQAGDNATERVDAVLRAAVSSCRIARTFGEPAVELRWLDCAGSGLWLVTPEDGRVEIAPVSSDELARRLALACSADTRFSSVAAS
jgi:hypothetical protein